MPQQDWVIEHNHCTVNELNHWHAKDCNSQVERFHGDNFRMTEDPCNLLLAELDEHPSMKPSHQWFRTTLEAWRAVSAWLK